MADSESQIRKNGLEAPRNGLQISTWFLFPILITLYVITVFLPMPLSEDWDDYPADEWPSNRDSKFWYDDLRTGMAINVFFMLTMLLFGAIGVYNGYVACSINPIDPHLERHLATVPPVASTASPEKQFCWICQVHVSMSAIHCRHCAKCVSGFDHHCLWLNTCVGDRNYPQFWITVCAITGFTFTQVVGAVWMLGFYWAEKGWEIKRRAKSIFSTYENWGIVLHVYLFFLLLTLIMLLQLFFFHLNLRRTGQTTYNYIIADHKRIRAKEKVEKKRLEERKERRKKRLEEDKASSCAVSSEEFKEDVLLCCGCIPVEGAEKTDSCCPGGAPQKGKKKAGTATVMDSAMPSSSSAPVGAGATAGGGGGGGGDGEDEDDEYDDEDVAGGDVELGERRPQPASKNNRPGGGKLIGSIAGPPTTSATAITVVAGNTEATL